MAATTSRSTERYELVDRIAVGGMAEVFRAKAYGDHGFEKTLAIKRILPELARDPEFEERFIQEAKLAVQLTHANVVQVFDFGRFAGSLFIAMEHVDGVDLAALLRAAAEAGRTIPLAAAFHIAIELFRGLDFAHQRGVVHRDVSPSNILISRAGEVKIADFGIALAASDPGSGSSRRKVMGKWRYMSPEQTLGESLSTRSDLFSAGAVLYELFTGSKLFPGDDAEEIIANIHSMAIPRATAIRPELPIQLDALLARLLSRRPEDRPARASDSQRALTAISYEGSIVATALEVAELVHLLFGEPVEMPVSAPPRAARAVDDLILAQLGEAPELPGLARRTAIDHDHAGAADSAPGHATVVRAGVGADGLTVWEFDRETLAEGPAARRQGKGTGARSERLQLRRGRGPRAAAVVALTLVALAGVVTTGLLWSRDGAGDPHAAVAHKLVVAPEPQGGVLSIDSLPQGAAVWLDGVRQKATTPLSIAVSPGKAHEISIEKPGYRRWSDRGLVLEPGETVRMRTTLQPLRASLRVFTRPQGAQVSLDGRVLGETPLVVHELEPRQDAELVITRAEFKPVRVKVDLVGDETAIVQRNLAHAVVYGEINLFIDEGWADVYLRGRKIGQAPVRGLRLPVGHHRLRLHNPQTQREKRITVDVASDAINYYREQL